MTHSGWKFGLVALLAVACHQAGPPESSTAANANNQGIQLAKMGHYYAARGDMLRAEEYLAAALRTGANPDKTLPALVRASVAAKHYETATQLAEAYLPELSQPNPTRVVIAGVYSVLGNHVRARELLEEVLKTDPLQTQARFLLAKVLLEGFRDLARADIEFREYLRLEPDGAFAPQAREGLLLAVSGEPIAQAVSTSSGDSRRVVLPIDTPAPVESLIDVEAPK